MNKFKKYLVIFSCLVIVFSILSIPVSAISYVGNFNVPISKPTSVKNGGFIEVLAKGVNNTYFVEVYLVFAQPIDDTNVSIGDCYIDCDVGPRNITLTGYGVLDMESISLCLSIVSDSGSIYTYQPTDRFTISYTYDILAVRCYGNVNFGSITNNNISNNDYNFNVTYGDTSQTNFLLQALIGNLPDNEELASNINDNANQNAADIQDNANQNAADIQDNANQNAADIQANQDKNTSEILNGWQSDEDVSSGDSDSLANAEDELISGNEDAAKNEISDVNDSVLGSLQRLASSFGATGSLFRQLTVRIPDFSVLVYFSLAIGILPLIVGLSINGLRSSDRRVAKSKRNKGG